MDLFFMESGAKVWDCNTQMSNNILVDDNKDIIMDDNIDVIGWLEDNILLFIYCFGSDTIPLKNLVYHLAEW